jgi:hypothetical protein
MTTPGHEQVAPSERPALRYGIPAAIFLITLLSFLPTFGNDLIDLDDQALLVENDQYRNLEWKNLTWMLRATNLGHWQPLTWLSYAIDYQIAGEPDPRDPAAFRDAIVMFHTTSLAVHSMSAVLLYLVALRLMAAAGLRGLPLNLAAAAGALFWSVHPLRVESVAWATERRDVMSGVFLLGATLAYLNAFRPRTAAPTSIAAYAASVVLLIFSLLSKPWGMSFFVIVTIIDWYPLRRLPDNPFHWLRAPYRNVLVQKLPYLVLGLCSATIANYAMKSTGSSRTLAEWPMASRIAQTFYGLVWYPARTLWPTALSPLYELRHGLNPLAPEYLFCYALVAVGALALFLFRRRIPAATAAFAIYAVCISPVLGLTQAGDQFVADRYSYLSTISLSVAAAGGLCLLALRLSPPGRKALVVLAAAAVVALSAATYTYTASWKDGESVWKHAWQTGPDRMMPHINYAGPVLKRAVRDGIIVDPALFDEGLEHLRIATRLNPDDGRGWYPLGNALRTKGDLAGAEAAYRQSAKNLPQAYLPLVNLGNMLNEEGRFDDALAAYRAAVAEIDHPRPGSIPSAAPYLSLGAFLRRHGDPAGARAAFERALDLADQERDPDRAAFVRGQARAHLREMDAGK